MDKSYFTYILGSKTLVLYVGSTSDLRVRVYQHKHGLVEGFTKRYNVKGLLYYEIYDNPNNFVKREKQLKNWHREWKLNLIKSKNPEFRDLYEEILK